ncbi:MAG: acyl-CoA dehydrogenase [Sphingobacteriales bacterium]|jgi:butyryl-CoA dehydrogenase|nr:MAG: acyl-CoA dehydrogenase [Sphingobacteriales bacterium]
MTNNVFLGDQFYSKEHLHFLLHDVFNVKQLLDYKYFNAHDIDSINLFLDATEQLCKEHFFPIWVEMDRKQPELIDGRVRVHPNIKKIMRICGEGGWINTFASNEVGGLQMPMTISIAASFIMGCANYSVTAFSGLTSGAAHLIESFASKTLQETYIPKMFAGEWQGTMALTEPNAGSSLSDIVTSAEKIADGTYKIKGQKIFISCGDHDGVDNVIHLLLARIKGAPAGTKGISMFVVPRERINTSNQLEYNDVATAGVYHKMGYKGAPITHLMFGENDDCIGYLVGEEHKGLSYMFQMMNEARISVGLHATSISTASYYAALKYCKERQQGRKIEDKNILNSPVPIIQHADVKRMLLFQKAFTEGALALELQCSIYHDLSKIAEGEEKEKNHLLLELLTPVAKSYPSETSILSTSTALQCYGGYGFTKDFPAEQYMRETRIHTLHEGTTAIHGLDLLGRKVMLQNGKATMLLMQEVMQEINQAKAHEQTKEYALQLEKKMVQLQELTIHLVGVAQKEGVEAYLSDATLYLELMGIMIMCWQWLKMSNIAIEKLKNDTNNDFLLGKLKCLEYYFEYELPKTEALLIRLKSTKRTTIEITEEQF